MRFLYVAAVWIVLLASSPTFASQEAGRVTNGHEGRPEITQGDEKKDTPVQKVHRGELEEANGRIAAVVGGALVGRLLTGPDPGQLLPLRLFGR